MAVCGGVVAVSCDIAGCGCVDARLCVSCFTLSQIWFSRDLLITSPVQLTGVVALVLPEPSQSVGLFHSYKWRHISGNC